VRIVVVVLVLLVALAAILFALGVFGAPAPAPEGGGAHGPTAPAVPGEAGVLAAPAPKARPAPKAFPLAEDVHVLLLAGVPQRIPLFLAEQWAANDHIHVHSWAPGVEAENVPPPSVLPGALDAPPSAGTLRDLDVRVPVVHDIDPAVLDASFWTDVAERVHGGHLGLLVQPGIANGAAMLAHPVLGGLVPVAKAKKLEGSPLPGVFGHLVPFTVTEAGTHHPASRLVPWPTWSKRIWTWNATGDFPWGTSFCYPVSQVADGATILLGTNPAHGKAWPALVAGSADGGRVLWLGAWELGSRKAYGQPAVLEGWSVLVDNWVAWLSGQVTG